MLVSHRKQFIYLKTVKTGGTSVESYFEPYCMRDGEWQQTHSRDEYESEAGIVGYRGADGKGKRFFNHISANALRVILPEEIWENYFKFAVVRDPFDKQISAFFFFVSKQGDSVGVSFEERVHQFRAWLKRTRGIYDGDKYLIDGNFILDDYIKYELLHTEISRVGAKLGIPFLPERLPNFKSEFRPQDCRSVSDFYDQECLDIVAERYKFELIKFGYQVPKIG